MSLLSGLNVCPLESSGRKQAFSCNFISNLYAKMTKMQRSSSFADQCRRQTRGKIWFQRKDQLVQRCNIGAVITRNRRNSKKGVENIIIIYPVTTCGKFRKSASAKCEKYFIWRCQKTYIHVHVCLICQSIVIQHCEGSMN